MVFICEDYFAEPNVKVSLFFYGDNPKSTWRVPLSLCRGERGRGRGETWRAARRSNTSDKRETEHKTSEHDQIQCIVFWRSPVVCETYEYTNWGAALRSVERLLGVTLNCSEGFPVPGVITHHWIYNNTTMSTAWRLTVHERLAVRF